MQISADPEIMGIDDVFLDLCFESDFEPPMISSVSSGYCSIIITVSDDVAVDTANTAVVVKSANGNNITDLLTRTNMDNGSLGSIILQPTQIGLYSVTILPKDKSGNFGDEETRVISVNQCDGVNTTTSIPSAGGAGGSGGSSGGAPPPPVPECLETSDCDDGRYCDPKTSTCVECLQTSHCDDGLFCNGSESCYNNECVDGTSPCEQNETCHEILDTCLPEPECSTDAECDDGFFCNGQERCNEYIGICEQGEPPCNPDQLCMEALQECWGTKVLTAQSLQTVIKRPLIKEQRCPWLLLRVADDNHVDQSSTSALLGPSAEASGVAFDQSRAIFRFWRLIFVPICIDKDAAAGTWNLTIETDLKNPANLLKEIIKASFEIR